jgi:hypothetical protein
MTSSGEAFALRLHHSFASETGISSGFSKSWKRLIVSRSPRVSSSLMSASP